MTDAPRPRAARADVLDQLLAGQATADQRFDELFRRLDKVESDASEARDTSKELVTILREQDIGARIVELRTELRESVGALRQDYVAANTRLATRLDTEANERKATDDALSKRIAALESARNKVVGVADFITWLTKAAPWLFAGIAAYVAGFFKGAQ